MGSRCYRRRQLAPWAIIWAVSAPRAELSSLATALEELTKRLGGLAESLARSGSDELAADLYGVERALWGAHRRLSRLVDGLAG
jgi:hypothetical protein